MRVIYRPGNLRQASGQARTHFRYGKARHRLTKGRLRQPEPASSVQGPLLCMGLTASMGDRHKKTGSKAGWKIPGGHGIRSRNSGHPPQQAVLDTLVRHMQAQIKGVAAATAVAVLLLGEAVAIEIVLHHHVLQFLG